MNSVEYITIFLKFDKATNSCSPFYEYNFILKVAYYSNPYTIHIPMLNKICII